MLVPLVLSHLLARCATNVGPVTMSAVVEYESGGRAFAVGDNTAHRSYAPATAADAAALASRLLALGHDIDAGYAQINSSNFSAFGLSPATVFDPCTNVATGARILTGDYRAAARRYGPGQIALVHALSAYNAGSEWRGLAYARGVYALAAGLRYAWRPGTTVAARRAVAYRPASGTAP